MNVQGEGGVLEVLRDGECVVIRDEPIREGFGQRRVLSLSEARRLRALLLVAMQGARQGVLAELHAADGRSLFVKLSGAAVSLTEDVREHASWNLRLRDQVEAMHTALGQAINAEPVSDAPQEDTGMRHALQC